MFIRKDTTCKVTSVFQCFLIVISVCGHASLLDYLGEKAADLSTPDTHRAYPIHYAAQMSGATNEADRKTGLTMLQNLIDKGLPIDVKDKDNRQPLLWAASAGKLMISLQHVCKIPAEKYHQPPEIF